MQSWHSPRSSLTGVANWAPCRACGSVIHACGIDNLCLSVRPRHSHTCLLDIGDVYRWGNFRIYTHQISQVLWLFPIQSHVALEHVKFTFWTVLIFTRCYQTLLLQVNRYVNNLFDPHKKSIRNLMANLRQTCGASAGDVVTDKSLPADSPQCERVPGSGRQILHCDAVRCIFCRFCVADKTIACRRLCQCPRERQRSACWGAHMLALLLNIWCCLETRNTTVPK